MSSVPHPNHEADLVDGPGHNLDQPLASRTLMPTLRVSSCILPNLLHAAAWCSADAVSPAQPSAECHRQANAVIWCPLKVRSTQDCPSAQRTLPLSL